MFKRIAILGSFSVALLASEIALTKIFSVIFWYHFGFLILSTSMLGFALAGLFMRIYRERLSQIDPDKFIAYGIAASGFLLVISLSLITNNHFSPLSVSTSLADMLKLVTATLVLLPPFVMMGMVVLYMLQKWDAEVSRLYAANLLGSGLGCLAVLLLMDAVGGLYAYVIVAALMPLIAAFASFSWNKKLSLVFAALAVLIASSLIFNTFIYPLKQPNDKVAAWANEKKIVYSDWTSLSKVDIFEAEKFHSTGIGLWGLSPKNDKPLPERLGVVIDYWAYTTIIRHKNLQGYYDWYDYMPMYIAYQLLDKPEALVIGSGGGMDIRGALLNGASKVDAVEINPAIYDAMMNSLDTYSGDIYKLPNVKAHLAEGRRFVESSHKKWDIVQLSGVDTYSATQAGAFALSENFLYTKEALRSYLNHLKENGILTLTRWYIPSKNGLPRFSMRLFTLTIESLADMGYSEPWKHILFMRSGDFTVILIKNEPFNRKQIQFVEGECERRGFMFLYRPDIRLSNVPLAYQSYIDTPDRALWRDKYPFNVDPPTDDSPFFFEHRKMKNIYDRESFVHRLLHGFDGQTILAILLLEMLLVSLTLMVISYKLRSNGGGRPLGWLYFAAIGLGFMMFEVTFTQRLVLFLGNPANALSVVMFSILVFSGLGSMLGNRICAKVPLSVILLLVVVGMILWAAGGGPLLNALIAIPKFLRIITAIILLAPISFLMGMAFPQAVKKLNDSGEHDLGIYWAWNGVASVTASVLAVIIAMGVGFSLVLWLAAVSYLLAAIVAPRLSRNV